MAQVSVRDVMKAYDGHVQAVRDINKAGVGEAARILDIVLLLERKPKALSDGQRQRVAMGRAIVRDPKVFLFDGPHAPDRPDIGSGFIGGERL